MSVTVAKWTAVTLLTAFVGQFAIALADERGYYTHPGAKIAAFLRLLTDSAPAHWTGGLILGFAVGMWLDSFMRHREEEVAPVDTRLRIQFHHGNTLPSQIEHANIWSWYAVYQDVVAVDQLGREVARARTWVLSLVFNKPTLYRQLRVDAGGGPIPRHEVRFATSRHAVITIEGDPVGMVLSIYAVL